MIYIPDLLWAIYQAYSEPLFVSLDSCSHDIYTRPRLTLNHSLSLCPCAISLLLFQDHSPFPFPFPCALDHSATLLLCQAAGLLLSWSAYTHDKPPACPCVIALLCNLSFAVPGITLIISHSLAVLLCQGLPGSLSFPQGLPGSLSFPFPCVIYLLLCQGSLAVPGITLIISHSLAVLLCQGLPGSLSFPFPFPCALDHSATLLRQGLPGSLSFPFPCVIYLLLCQGSLAVPGITLIISHSLAVLLCQGSLSSSGETLAVPGIARLTLIPISIPMCVGSLCHSLAVPGGRVATLATLMISHQRHSHSHFHSMISHQRHSAVCPCVIYLLLCQAHSHSHFHSHVQSFFLRRQALIISHSLAVPGTVYLILIYYDWFSMRLLMSGKPCSQLATSTSWGTDAYIQCS